ncbi:MAG: hypothetical protein DRH26_13720 [Deltaproteobacteria bacterium]|nr:MAG: hypothetical protein DRH26_13720 [Deltaproteobacteria bacterium]
MNKFIREDFQGILKWRLDMLRNQIPKNLDLDITEIKKDLTILKKSIDEFLKTLDLMEKKI